MFDSIQDTASLDAQVFESLENRVSQVLDRLKALQAENRQLAQQLEDLQSRYDESKRRIEELNAEREQLMANQRDPEVEEMIRTRIRSLLNKLDAL